MRIIIYLPMSESKLDEANNIADKVVGFLEQQGIGYVGLEVSY
jgi:hypothetical protein